MLTLIGGGYLPTNPMRGNIHYTCLYKCLQISTNVYNFATTLYNYTQSNILFFSGDTDWWWLPPNQPHESRNPLEDECSNSAITDTQCP